MMPRVSGSVLRSVWVVVVLFATICLYSASLSAQTVTTGAIAGSVSDPSGALVPNATLTATSIATGIARTVKTSAAGVYTIPELRPGQYNLKVEASGFKTIQQGPIVVAIEQTSTLNITLELGSSTQIIEVSAAAALIQTENANTTATVGQEAIANLPNPGMDLTFAAQVAPGATMNTSGGYGNVEFNGLPSESTNFSIDGVDANDPFLNLNNSGATNLQLGLNSIQEVTVNTLSFSVDEGRQGAAQVNYISKSGSNKFHGNAYETWNGSHMNATDYFLKATGPSPASCIVPGTNLHYGVPGCKPFSNVNQFGGSVGGPIMKDKLFFFFDWEQIRIVLPVAATDVVTPTQAFENDVLNSLTTGNTYAASSVYTVAPYYDPLNDTTFGPMTNTGPAITYYKHMFDLYGSKAGSPQIISGCWFNADGSAALALNDPTGTLPWGDGCANKHSFGIGNFTKDRLWTARVDEHAGNANAIWEKFTYESGVQATGTDPINSAFNPYSSQPQVSGALGWTHTFSPSVVNEFNPGFFWYSAIFGPVFPKAIAVSPFEYDGPFTSIWSTGDQGYPQGRKVTDWQVVDNLSWSHGAHQFKPGVNLRRTLISDWDPSASIAPDITPGDIYEWAFGVADYAAQSFVKNGVQPIGVTNLDMYFGDTWKVKRNLTISYGLRGTWNSNMISQRNAYSQMTGNFYSISHDVNQPLNAVMKTGLSNLFPSTQMVVLQPRAALAWEVKPNTVFRLGGGKFSDLFPYALADTALTNFPNVNAFGAGVSGSVPGIFAIPGTGDGTYGSGNNDVVTALAQANQAVVSGFANGATSCYAASPTTPCLSRPNITAFPSKFMPYPYFLEWNAGVEHQFGNNFWVKVEYVGTHATQMAFSFRPNARELYCTGCFTPYRSTRLDNRFGTITQWDSGTNSSYNAMQVTVQKRMSHGLMFATNYAWSHCLDEISNGGRFSFNLGNNLTHPHPGGVGRMYGNCDYDVRHTLNGSYVYSFPTFSHNRFLGQVVNGWQISGDVFLHTGYPFTAVSNIGSTHFSGTNGPVFANANAHMPLYSRGVNMPGVTVAHGSVQWVNPWAFTSVINPSTGVCVGGNNATNCQFGDAGRNTLFAPGFRWSDFLLTKRFKLRENLAFRVEGQFYNVFNHANFAYPGNSFGLPGTGSMVNSGIIQSTTAPFTGLLGSGLGGDTSVRMIALSGKIEF